LRNITVDYTETTPMHNSIEIAKAAKKYVFAKQNRVEKSTNIYWNDSKVAKARDAEQAEYDKLKKLVIESCKRSKEDTVNMTCDDTCGVCYFRDETCGDVTNETPSCDHLKER